MNGSKSTSKNTQNLEIIDLHIFLFVLILNYSFINYFYLFQLVKFSSESINFYYNMLLKLIIMREIFRKNKLIIIIKIYKKKKWEI